MSLKPVSQEALRNYQQYQAVLPLQQAIDRNTAQRVAEEARKEREARLQASKMKKLSSSG